MYMISDAATFCRQVRKIDCKPTITCLVRALKKSVRAAFCPPSIELESNMLCAGVRELSPLNEDITKDDVIFSIAKVKKGQAVGSDESNACWIRW